MFKYMASANEIDTKIIELEQGGQYTFRAYTTDSTRRIEISGTFINGPKKNWKVTFFTSSGQIIKTDIYTTSDGSINVPILEINKSTEIIKVEAECVDVTGEDIITGQSRIGEKLSTFVTINNSESYTFIASQLSTLFTLCNTRLYSLLPSCFSGG